MVHNIIQAFIPSSELSPQSSIVSLVLSRGTQFVFEQLNSVSGSQPCPETGESRVNFMSNSTGEMRCVYSKYNINLIIF